MRPEHSSKGRIIWKIRWYEAVESASTAKYLEEHAAASPTRNNYGLSMLQTFGSSLVGQTLM
jgi:hypothetical protein